MFKRKNSWLKHSFSQSGEDLIVKFIFDCLGIPKPSYIDIGAHHPFYISNTALLYENGSRGINIEPDPTLFKEFIKYRNEDINLNIGISSEAGELNFYIINNPTLNTFSKKEADSYHLKGNFRVVDTKKIEVYKIENIIDKYFKGIFPQFITIDAEGIDELIIESIDFVKSFPIVICIETISFSHNGNGEKNIKLIELIKSKGYLLYADTNINSIFVRIENWVRE